MSSSASPSAPMESKVNNKLGNHVPDSSSLDASGQTTIVYITKGVSGGQERRKQLLMKLHEYVLDTSKDLRLPRWRALPFPTEVTCAVSDNLKEERTLKLLRQGILIVKSSWVLACVMERRLLLPIDEARFRLFYDDSNTTISAPQQPLYSRFPLIHIKSSCPKQWSKQQDDLVEVIHRARIAGDHEKARLFEGFLVERGRSREHIQDREKHLFGWSASVFE